MERSASFGAWLRHQRKGVRGWTQAELAHRVACSETMIRKIEKDERRPAKDLAERLMKELRVPSGEFARNVAWARGLTINQDASAGQAPAHASDVQLGSLIDDALLVLVPLDAVASFGTEPPTIVQLQEPFQGRIHWVPIPLATLTTFGLEPPCWGDACNGQDPEASGCAENSVTIDGRNVVDPRTGVVVATVELRYSRACQCNWVRVTRFCQEQRSMEAYLRDEAGTVIATTRVKVQPSHVYGYGAMWFAPTGKVRVRACGVIEGYEEVRTSLH